MGSVAEAEQDPGGMPRSAKRRRSRASGATPMPPPTRIAPAAPGLTSRGSEKALPSGPVTQTPSPASSSQSRSVPGPIALDQEVEPHAVLGRGRLGDRERPRQEGRSPAPSQWRSAASM